MARLRNLSVFLLLTLMLARVDAADWPSDFWTQLTNSMALPSGAQIAVGVSEVDIDCVDSATAAVCYAIGDGEFPFSSCWRSRGVSNATGMDSRPCGTVLMIR